MIEFRLSLQALGTTRFGYSPLGELTSSLRALDTPHGGPLLRPWLRHVANSLPPVNLTVLRAVVPPGYLAPDFMFAWTTDPRTTIEDQLEALLALPDDVIARDLAAVWAGRTPPPVVERLPSADGRAALADALQDYWDAAVRPYWARIRSGIDDDVAYRANQVLSGGLYDVLTDLHPEVSLREDVLAIDKPHHPDAVFATPTLTLIPSVFVWPHLIVAQSTPGCFELQYAVRGVGRVWEGLTGDDDDLQDAFAALVGRARAAILVALATPQSTTLLARTLHQSPGSVSAHLSVLRRNGLVSSTREGRSVVYRRTTLATSILGAGEGTATSGELA
jgi:DNA-binding transcriptional ArsR family regulator